MSVISLENLLVCPKKQWQQTCGVPTVPFVGTFYPSSDLISPLTVILSAVRLNKHPCVPPSPILSSTPLHSSLDLQLMSLTGTSRSHLASDCVSSDFASVGSPPCPRPQLLTQVTTAAAPAFEPFGSHAVLFFPLSVS